MGPNVVQQAFLFVCVMFLVVGHMALADGGQSVAWWQKALSEHPLEPDNHIGLGDAFSRQKDFPEAAEEYKQAIRLSPGRRNATAERLLADLGKLQKDSVVNKHVSVRLDLKSKKSYTQAISPYKRALQADPLNDSTELDSKNLDYPKSRQRTLDAAPIKSPAK